MWFNVSSMFKLIYSGQISLWIYNSGQFYSRYPILCRHVNCNRNQTLVLQLDIIILSYAFKMRQDYLSTSYLNQKYLPSERSETREIWIDPSNVCWDNPVSFLKAYDIFLTPFTILQMKYLENMTKPVKVEHGCRPLSFALLLRSHHVDYAHHVSYECTPWLPT